MSPQHLAETLFQGRRVEWTIHVNSHRDVVSVTHRLQLIEEPHPLLRKRQRQLFIPGDMLNRSDLQS